ncbi:ABC transporter substrate-binding protein [Pseudofrankia inefficax]|uniref:Branched chain amino acid ABC transporter solute-binding protein n=1 Tax=Pseudofrankia inefficax (strain DSM 45817 / CECT 9037 / DDB 130130 / EuI1c) TaxID=298654 RepID=E3J9L2_PSEI1|nr:ABC transporter substrate-binding protein [Pseudofrankia inefficax]ADP83376.1 branched chain amino acid ABC transporter solute-binding protein [Pseudofrankia inefficax]
MSSPGRSRLVRAGALAVIATSLAAGLAGCGSSGSATSAASCSTQVPGITSTTVNAGLLWSDSGDGASSMPDFRSGVDARFGLANESGGVFGRTVSYAWRDDQSSQDLNLLGAQDLVGRGHVFGIIEAPGASNGSITWLNQQNIPVTGLASDPGWVGRNNMFSFYYLSDGSSTVWGDVINAAGASRAAVLEVSGNKSNSDFSRQYEASLLESGVKIVREFQIAEAVTNYQAVAKQLKQDDIDALVGVLLPSTAAKLIPAARSLGVNLKITMMPLGYDPAVLASSGKAIAGTIIFTEVQPWLDTPRQQTFEAAMAKYAPEIQSVRSDSAVDGFVAADIFIRGLQAAGKCPTRESFISGLRAVTNYDGFGLVPAPVNFATNLKAPQSCYNFIQVRADGSAFDPMFGGQARCGRPISSARMNQLLDPGSS